MARSSNKRKMDYVQLFSEIDDIRTSIISLIVEKTCANIFENETENEEAHIDNLLGKLEFVNEISANIVNAIEENEVLGG